jgi:hypothetical protein
LELANFLIKDFKLQNLKLENSFNHYYYLTNKKSFEFYKNLFSHNNLFYSGNRPSLPMKINHSSFKDLVAKKYEDYVKYELIIWNGLNNSLDIKKIYEDLRIFIIESRKIMSLKSHFSSQRRFVRKEISHYFSQKNKSVKLFLDTIIYLKTDYSELDLIVSNFLEHIEKFYPNHIKI